MERRVVALGLDTHIHEYPWVNESECERFPGTCFLPVLRSMLRDIGWELRLGEEVAHQIASGEISPNHVRVLQIEESEIGSKLVSLGSLPTLLLNLESPVFVSDLYLNLEKLANSYRHSLVLCDPSHYGNASSKIERARFPVMSNKRRLESSREPSDSERAESFEKKRLACIISNNKYWRRVGVKFVPRNLAKASLVGSPAWKRHQLRKTSLHSLRLRLISTFLHRGKFDVWGSGWGTEKLPFPHNFDKRMRRLVAQSLPYEKKIDTLARYKFSLVLENCEFPGYVTDKIFDAFLAGCVPIYWGAPDIEKYVPRGTFVAGNQFDTLGQLFDYIDNMSYEEHSVFLSEAQSYLRSEAAHEHTFEGFAEKLFQSITDADF